MFEDIQQFIFQIVLFYIAYILILYLITTITNKNIYLIIYMGLSMIILFLIVFYNRMSLYFQKEKDKLKKENSDDKSSDKPSDNKICDDWSSEECKEKIKKLSKKNDTEKKIKESGKKNDTEIQNNDMAIIQTEPVVEPQPAESSNPKLLKENIEDADTIKKQEEIIRKYIDNYNKNKRPIDELEESRDNDAPWMDHDNDKGNKLYQAL